MREANEIEKYLPKRAHLTPAEIANFLGVSTREVYNLITDDVLPVVRLGRLLKIRREAFATWYSGISTAKGKITKNA